MTISPSIRIAVLVPCFNEEAAVATVVADFRKALPSAEIFVYDNNSSDRTVAVARDAGAQVRSERRQGKGHVVRRMFADVDADLATGIQWLDNQWSKQTDSRLRQIAVHQAQGDLDAAAHGLAEVEELVEPGAIAPDQIITPGIFVQHLLQGAKYEKRIEKRTTRHG